MRNVYDVIILIMYIVWTSIAILCTMDVLLFMRGMGETIFGYDDIFIRISSASIITFTLFVSFIDTKSQLK